MHFLYFKSGNTQSITDPKIVDEKLKLGHIISSGRITNREIRNQTPSGQPGILFADKGLTERGDDKKFEYKPEQQT